MKSWTLDFPSFEIIYRMIKIDFGKYSKFFLKFKVHVITRFWVLNFHATWWILFHASFPMFVCLLSYFVMFITHLPKLWYPCLAFHRSSWILTRLFPHLTFLLIFQNLKWSNMHHFLHLNLRSISKMQFKLMTRALASIWVN